jgi:hypothetical protein
MALETTRIGLLIEKRTSDSKSYRRFGITATTFSHSKAQFADPHSNIKIGKISWIGKEFMVKWNHLEITPQLFQDF